MLDIIRYYQQKKKKKKKSKKSRYQNLTEKEKTKKWEYGRERYKNLSEDKKERLVEYIKRLKRYETQKNSPKVAQKGSDSGATRVLVFSYSRIYTETKSLVDGIFLSFHRLNLCDKTMHKLEKLCRQN